MGRGPAVVVAARGKRAVFAIGAAGLAVALTLAAFASPEGRAVATPVYMPASDDTVVARVPRRDSALVALRAELAARPDAVDAAVALARAHVTDARATGDPRHLGWAEATLGPWWQLTDPPLPVLLLRATIRQANHDFAGALGDLDRLLAARPDDAQALLTRAVVRGVRGELALATADCEALVPLVPELIVAACRAPLDGGQGREREAYQRLARALGDAPGADAAVRAWALGALAELARVSGDVTLALAHAEAAVAIDPRDVFARAALADLLLEAGRPADAAARLAGPDVLEADVLLLRLALASRDPDHIGLLRARFAAAAARGDRLHLREQARFALELDARPAEALALALDNWAIQREPADARVVLAAAVASGDRAAAAPVLAWLRETGNRDVGLRALARAVEAR